MTIRVWFGVLLLWAAASGSVRAQVKPEEVPADARFSLGPLKLNPTIAITNMGIDSNVFNAADTDHPQSDFTTTLTPRSDLWMQLGHAWLTGAVSEDLVYYREFAGERSINSTYRGNLWLPLNRLTLNAGTGYLSTRDRPGYEIDSRSRHSEADYHGSIEMRTFGKTNVGLSARRTRIAFVPDAVYLGRNLEHELNRTTTSTELSVRHALTPVTDMRVVVAREEDRFEFSPIRDSNSTRVAGTMLFHARLGGTASLGYRDFRPLAADVPAYRGATASVDMAILGFGSSRFGVQAIRDLDYSYDIEQPYYVETGTGLSVTQAVSGSFDVVGRYGLRQLAYRGRLGATVAGPDRTDFIHWFGGGIGYRVGRDMRIGINVQKQRRTSDVVLHGYDGLQFGMSVTYGR